MKKTVNAIITFFGDHISASECTEYLKKCSKYAPVALRHVIIDDSVPLREAWVPKK